MHNPEGGRHPGPQTIYGIDWQLGRDTKPTDVEIGAALTSARWSAASGVLKIGQWKIGDTDGNHLTFWNVATGNTANIYTSDGTEHPGPRTDWQNTWEPTVAVTFDIVPPKPEGFTLELKGGVGFIELGKWRIGIHGDGNHFVISHRERNIAVFAHDGTVHAGVSEAFNLFQRPLATGALSPAGHGITIGQGYVQFNVGALFWHVADIDSGGRHHLSFTHSSGNTCMIYRCVCVHVCMRACVCVRLLTICICTYYHTARKEEDIRARAKTLA